MKTKASRYPQSVNENFWYYEEDNKIICVYDIYDKNKYIRTDQISIPKHMLNKSLKRMNYYVKR